MQLLRTRNIFTVNALRKLFGIEIEARLNFRAQRGHALVTGGDSASELAGKLCLRHLGSARRPRLDQIHHSLGLCQIQAAVEKGAARELARFSQACAGCQDHPQDLPWRHISAMPLQLNHILAGKTGRRTKEQDQGIVNEFPGPGIGNPSIEEGSGLPSLPRATRHYAGGHLPRVSPRNPHHRHARRAGSRGYGGDRIAFLQAHG